MQTKPQIKPLSERQREVAILVATGYTDAEIAETLYISRRRVGEAIYFIKEKWNIHSRVQIGVFAYHFGLLKWSEEKNSYVPEGVVQIG
ncbi:response regulator transcription factor [Halobacillus sp. MO56]